jgi:hypothetical protein
MRVTSKVSSSFAFEVYDGILQPDIVPREEAISPGISNGICILNCKFIIAEAPRRTEQAGNTNSTPRLAG